MFDFIKRFIRREKENDFGALLSLDDISFTNAVFRLFEIMDPATRAHVVVAYQNLVLLLSALHSHGEKTGENVTIEGFIREISANLGSYRDEINSRRMAWTLFAALLGRLEKLALGNNAINIIGARIWCILVSEIPRLKILLPENVVWKAEEKVWFEISKTDAAMIQDGINHIIPLIFAKTEPVKNLAKALGLFYWPSESRFGIIP